MLPFTREAFLGVFVDYNEAIWPAEVVAHLLDAAAGLEAELRCRLAHPNRSG